MGHPPANPPIEEGFDITAASTIDSVRRFQALPSALGEFSVEVSEPWHFNESGGRVPFESECGIYLYTEPGDPVWRLPLAENQNAVWYVGKSGGSIGGRVWSHMGSIYDPTTGTTWTPRFKRHRWAEANSVPQDIRHRLAHGDVVVYALAVRAERNAALLAELLEKHVLVEFVLTHGHQPPLNLQL